ncbi:hypothetical protein [Orenia metallireducens]|nr:hypothetical protein [Orenia metallireducens]
MDDLAVRNHTLKKNESALKIIKTQKRIKSMHIFALLFFINVL